jgi:hypothetical protein
MRAENGHIGQVHKHQHALGVHVAASDMLNLIVKDSLPSLVSTPSSGVAATGHRTAYLYICGPTPLMDQ